ncbi:Altered inheritance of mitochondria protein 18 mitochondrial [Coniothyrium glycines]
MMPIRQASRRPIYQCLISAPAPVRSTLRSSPQLRHGSRYARNDMAYMLKQSARKPRRATAEYVSLHRQRAIELAALYKRRNRLALGAILPMIASILALLFWPLPPPPEDKKSEKSKEQHQGSRGIVDMIVGPPTKNDAPRKAADEFQGKKVVIAAGDKVIAASPTAENPQASDPDAIELVETGTSYVPYFPRTIRLPTDAAGPGAVSSDAEYQLLGLGIRKVSFLRVQVYVVGLYVKTADISTLQNHLINTINPTASALIPGEKDALRQALLDPEQSNKIWEAILSKDSTGGVDMALRIVPCRSTDFKHLQDGWMRGIASRTDEVRRKQAELLRQQAAESKTLALPQPVEESEFTDESFGLAMKEFKNLFHGKGKAPKGSVIVLTRNKAGALGALYQPLLKSDQQQQQQQQHDTMGKATRLGEVKDERVGRLVWLLYLGGQNVSSEPARQNIVEGCIGITERPVGTVEGRVL